MDIKKLRTRFRQLGGIVLLREYARIGALPTLVRELVRIQRKGLPPKAIYPALEEKVQPVLMRRYEPLMDDMIARYSGMDLRHAHSDKLWFCWLQGMQEAPDLVRACMESQRRNIKGRRMEIISYDTYNDFITLPDHIVRKHREGKIPHPHFSDLIRLELLIRHGGTWIDSTVLCTGGNFPQEVLDCDLFLFQYRDARTRRLRGFSNWFITACTDNKVLLVLRDMLYQYWRDYDCVLDYYVFHLFFSMIARRCTEEMAAMPRSDNRLTLLLGDRIRDGYDGQWMRKLTSACAFHKLNYRIKPEKGHSEYTYYDRIIEEYLEDKCEDSRNLSALR